MKNAATNPFAEPKPKVDAADRFSQKPVFINYSVGTNKYRAEKLS